MSARAMSGRLAPMAMLALAVAVASPAAAQPGAYRLQPGDVLEVVVAGLPDSPLRAPVQLDGRVTFPFIGDLDTTGSTMAELQSRVQNAFASRVIIVYTSDGREILRAIDRDQVTAAITEYRPIVVSGDVARQGELAFRPGMTVRQALAASGGAMRALAQPTAPVDPARLRADYLRAWYALAATEARLWRIQGELGVSGPFDAALPPAVGDKAMLVRLERLETELRDARATDHAREQSFLERSLEQIDRQAEVLTRQLTVETESEQIDAANLAAAVAADTEAQYARSRQSRLADLSQVADIRSAALISSTRRLQTEANLMQLQRRRTEVARELERLDDRRHMALLAELQSAEIERADQRAHLDDVREKLDLGGLADVATGEPQLAPGFAILRGSGGGAIRACLDDAVQPGDVLEVTLPPPPLAGMSEAAPAQPPYDCPGMITASSPRALVR